MRITLSKFGRVLTSRPAGREALLAVRPLLIPRTEELEIDFDGVSSLSPSWADEFLTPLKKMYGGRLTFLPSDNPSVVETLRILNLS